MKQLQKQRFGIILFILLSAVAILYSLKQMLSQEVFQWIINQIQYKSMMAETALLFTAFVLSGVLLSKNWQKLVAVLVAFAVFIWVHVVFVPVAVSGIYLVYMLFFGRYLRVAVCKLPSEDGIAADFLTGSSFLILTFCLMSALGIGGITYLTVFVLVSAILLMVFGRSCLKFHREKIVKTTYSVLEILFFAVILTMIGIQAGRLNISVDYDSLWYGVRSPYILDNGRGIYENMGTIGVVYTYSKGFEVLTLPLSTLPSYSFLTSVNLWLAGGVLYLGYKIGRFYLKREHAIFLAVLLSINPGIMNMAVSAKSDMITLLVQEIMLYYLLSYRKEGGSSWRYLGYAVGAFLLSLTMKPTALVFSTAVFGMAFLYMLYKRLSPKFDRKIENIGVIAVMAGSVLAVMGIWARTLLITGLPVTSVFSSIFCRMGFEVKYPLLIQSIPNCTKGISLHDKVCLLAGRFYGFFLSPIGKGMDHVILAWGGFVLVFLFLLWIISHFYGKNVDRGEEKTLSDYFNVIYLSFLIVNLISLGMLSQVDGNYFMFFYVLTTVFVLKSVSQATSKIVWKGAYGAGICVLLFALFVTTTTNWNWSLGFTPVSLHHKGYYNHQEVAREEMISKGNRKIWNILAANPQNRLIAIGKHPDVLIFPCSAQSYADITGVWGNVVLVKKMDYFVQFMDYAKTDYVYVQAGYAGEKDRAYTLVRDLIGYGKLEPVCYEEGNLLAKVNVKGMHTKKSVKALTEFKHCYIKKKAKDKR